MRRELRLEMKTWLDKKLENFGAAQEAKRLKDARSLFGYTFESMVGITESGGNNRGPLVSLIQDTVGGPDHVAWCMSAVQTALAYVEAELLITSPIAVSEHCMSVWSQTPKEQRVARVPGPYAIIIWQHGKGPAGHTGIVRRYRGDVMDTSEANTGDGSMRDGDGIYHRVRSTKANGEMRVVGFLKPF